MTNIVPKFNTEKIHFVTTNSKLKNGLEYFVESWNDNEDFFLTYTSGSTGFPKEVKLKKELALNSVRMSNGYFHYDQMQKIALCLSPETIGGKMQILRALYYNLDLYVFENERNPFKKLEEKLDFVTLVPLQLEAILVENPEKLKLCKRILIGGAKLSTESVKQTKDLDCQIYESYGMSETYSHVALKQANNVYFEALPGVEFSLENSNLVIHAPLLELAALKTNDCVNLIDPTHFELLGRSDFVINSGGYKFHPEILEEKIRPFLKENFFIIGQKDATYGEIVTFIIEKVYSETNKTLLLELFDTVFSSYEKPKKLYFTEEFVKTESGKIDKLQTQAKVLEP